MSEPDNEGLSILDHLDELRNRLIICVSTLLVGAVFGFFVAGYPLEWLTKPLVRAQQTIAEQRQDSSEIQILVAEDGTLRLADGSLELVGAAEQRALVFLREADGERLGVHQQALSGVLFYRSPVDSVMIWLKASLVIGLVLGMPMILYQTYAFVAPGLLRHEKQLVLPLILAGSLLFPLGAIFAYFLLELALLLFSTFAVSATLPINDANAYLSFALMLMVVFGVVFEFPLAVVLATRLGIVETRFLAERRKYVFVTMLIVCALVTPPDVFTLAALVIPLYLLFEISLLVSSFLDRLARRKEAEEVCD